jgi:uncharacterized protein
MTIAWSEFTPWHALGGGALIGAAAALYVLGVGRIAGIAGIVGTPWKALWQRRQLAGQGLRLWFVLGLLLAPWLWRLVAPWPQVQVDASPPMLLLAGLLVGVGVRMGNGCTSGHGVCGLSRGSPRSLANVLAFMAAGFVTVFVLRHGL